MEVFPFITLRMAPSMFCEVYQYVYFIADQKNQRYVILLQKQLQWNLKKGFGNIKRYSKVCCLGDLTNSYASLLCMP